MGKARRSGVGFALLFVGFWSAITLLFDGFIGAGVVRQIQAGSFAATTGRIRSSEVTKNGGHGRDGPTYQAVITFEYSVAGRDYTGDHWRFGDWGTSSASEAEATVRRFPVGAPAPVYYDPARPERAVLVRGVQGLDSFLILFITPFNCVMLGGWVVLAGLLGGIGPVAPHPLAVPVWEAGGLTRVRMMSVYGPCFVGLGAAGIVAFVGVFAIAFGTRLRAPLPVVLGVWAGAVGCGLLLYARARLRMNAGRYDLTIDPVRRLLTLPPSVRAVPREVPFDQIQSIETAVGAMAVNGRRVSRKLLLKTAAAPGAIALVDRAGVEQMEALAAWLRERVGLSRSPASEPALAPQG